MTERRKKLIEVALPLEAISEESSRRKRKAPAGYPTTFHKWWAQRPLAACRAVLFASLVDDPGFDPAYREPSGTIDEESAGIKRAALFTLLEELIKWENSKNERVINAARAEIARCVASRLIERRQLRKDTIIFGENEGQSHPKGPLSGEYRTAWELVVHGHGDLESLANHRIRLCPPEVVNHFIASYAPPVLDPFAGGGSIPLEAQRLGLRAIASDLNPVAVLINKALIEIPPKFANLPPSNPEARGHLGMRQWRGSEGLADDIRYYGKWMRDEAEKRIGQLYPKVAVTKEMAKNRPDLSDCIGQQLTVVAWLWARTVKCHNPACGRRMPMLRSFWLSTKKGAHAWADPILDHNTGTVTFAIRHDGQPPKETSNRTMARCLFCNDKMKKGELRKTAREHGINEIPLAIVAEGTRRRVYLEPHVAQIPTIEKIHATEIEQLITDDKRWFSPPQYGLPTFRDLFTARQLTALETFSNLLAEARAKVLVDATAACFLPEDSRCLAEGGAGQVAYAEAAMVYLAAVLSRAVDYNSTIATWRPKDNAMRSTFSKQAMPMVWDFAEGNVFAKSSAGWEECVKVIAAAIEAVSGEGFGEVQQLDAAAAITHAGTAMTCTDPPYYSNIGYSDLSDYVYVWLRRALSSVFPSLFATVLTPKQTELIASAHRHKGGMREAKGFFEAGLRAAFTGIRRTAEPDYPTTVFYAFKQAETNDKSDSGTAGGTASTGWETMLAAFTAAGFVITGTWPMRTEGDNRSVGIGTNALASSVVLVGTPRPDSAPLATRREFLGILKRELPTALKHLQRGSIAPVDLAQAAIGPGMAVFSRFSKVVESDGSAMTVRSALTLINQTLDEVLAEQEGEFDSDTRWAAAWFEQHGTQEGPFGVAETLSKAKNTSVQGLVDAGLVVARGGRVRLIARDDMPEDWDPATDRRLTAWEATQHLIRVLHDHGEQAAAELLARLGGDYGEMARDLAYRLYNISERKGWSQEAIAYNSLVIGWSEISKLSRAVGETKSAQAELFE